MMAVARYRKEKGWKKQKKPDFRKKCPFGLERKRNVNEYREKF